MAKEKNEKISADVEEQQLREQIDATPLRKKRVIRNLISGAEFHDFKKDNAVFIGYYIRPVKREKDGVNVNNNPNEKAGTVMGYLFTELKNFETEHEEKGYDSIVGASEQITRAMEGAVEGDLYRFEFLGETTNSKNQPVNRFRIDKIEELP